MWQRWNSTSKIFEKSSDDGANWTALGLDAAILTQGIIASIARIATGTPDGTKFVRDDLTLAVPGGGSIDAASIVSGTISTARLGSGSASASTVLWGDNTWATPSLTRLIAAKGNSTNASAENVSSVAISGLTALDRLLVKVNLWSVTQQTAAPLLYNVTDAQTIIDILPGALVAGAKRPGVFEISNAELGATSIDTIGYVVTGINQSDITFTTNWTGSWTLALRHGGVTAGGTFRWSWAVYKLAGQ